MGIAGTLRTARVIRNPSLRTYEAVGATLTLCERLLAPLAVFVFLGETFARAAVLLGVASVVVAARGALQRSLVVQNQALLYRRIVGSALSGDVLEASLLPDREARDALFEGMYRVASVLAETAPNFVANAVAAVILIFVVLATEPPRVLVVATLALLGAGAVLFFGRGAVQTAQRRAVDAWDALADHLGDAFDARFELVASGTDGAFTRRFEQVALEWERRARRAAKVAGIMGRLPVAFLAGTVGAAVAVDAWRNGLSWPLASGRAALLVACTPAFLGIATCLQELAANEHRLEVTEKLVNRRPRQESGVSLLALPPKSIELRAVHFSYPGAEREALNGVSFVWQSGELLAMSGPNGAGKTTCLRALLGLADPTTGDILIDGVPLKRLDLGTWRSQVSFIPQRSYLPPRQTVRDCLRFLNPGADELTMQSAVARVDLPRRLRLQPAAVLDARLGHLSMGERQRVALARLLCRSTPVVMLDEPDANLDSEGLQLLAELLQEMRGRRMVLLVAHTAEILRAADRVVLLGTGTTPSQPHMKARSAQLQ